MRPVRTIHVCEPSPFWTPELQRQLTRDGVAVRPFAGSEDVIEQTVACVIVFDDGCPSAVPAELLRRLRDRRPETGRVVIVPENWYSVTWALWDIGATSILEATCGGERLAAVCRHMLQTTPLPIDDVTACGAPGLRVPYQLRDTLEFRSTTPT